MILPPNAFATHRLRPAGPVLLPGVDPARSRQAVFCLCVAVLLHVVLLKLWSTPVLLARGDEPVQAMLLVDVSLGDTVAEASAAASRALSSSTLSQDKPAPQTVEPEATSRPRATPRAPSHESRPRQAQSQTVRAQPSRQEARQPQPVSHPAMADSAPAGEVTPSATPSVMPMPAASAPREPVLVETPQFVSPPQYPAYPAVAQRRGQQGTVWLEIWLSETGKQLRLSIVRSSGFAVLDEAAKHAASSWQFMPHRLNGMVVASRVQVPVEFVIH